MFKGKKNKLRKKRIILCFMPLKSACKVIGLNNILFFLITFMVFFGLIIGSHIKLKTMNTGKGLKLSLIYKGEREIGNKLSIKGRQFLLNKRFTNVKASNILQELYSCYSRLPEVRKVCYVRKIYPERLEVKLIIREPFVKVKNVYFDEEGCRLSSQYNKIRKYMSVPIITGLGYPRSLKPGDIWENIYFKEALRALNAVGKKVDIGKIIIPSSSNTAFLDGIVLQTREGTLVYWGKVFGEGFDTGISVDRKMKNLENVLSIISANMDKVEYTDISREKPVISYK